MFNFSIKQSVLAAGLALGAAAAFAAPASATTYLQVISSSMDTTFQANVSGDGAVYSNGMTFSVKNYDPGTNSAVGPAFDIFGFCVDVFHNITIGNLGYVYGSNEDLTVTDPLPDDFGGHTVTPTQLGALTDLIDTGYSLHQHEVDTHNFDFDTEMRLAAIQAAIWTVEVPSRTISVRSNNLDSTQFATYQGYYNDYVAGNFTSAADANDRFYVISDGVHQSFGVGWPIAGVPEPATWAMMLMGFGGLGAILRRRRQALAAA